MLHLRTNLAGTLTCKANNVEPYQYLCVMLNRIRNCVTEDDYRKLLPQVILI
ncbi:MAG: transposase domain-containing protein [Gammaproteobacteria bacterium]